jgi:hypothetical protein
VALQVTNGHERPTQLQGLEPVRAAPSASATLSTPSCTSAVIACLPSSLSPGKGCTHYANSMAARANVPVWTRRSRSPSSSGKARPST